MSTFLRNKTVSKTTSLRKENPFPQFNVASHKRPGIRLYFEYTTTLLSGEGGEGRTATATMFRKMLSKYTIFSTVLSKIVDVNHNSLPSKAQLYYCLSSFIPSYLQTWYIVKRSRKCEEVKKIPSFFGRAGFCPRSFLLFIRMWAMAAHDRYFCTQSLEWGIETRLETNSE